MGDFLDYFKNRKNLVSLLILGILVLALPIGITLLRQQQILRSKAAGEPITFSGAGVTQKNGNWVSTTPQVTIKLTSPLGPPGIPIPSTVPAASPSQAPSQVPSQAPIVSPPPVPHLVSFGEVSYTTSANGIQHVAQSILADDGYSYGRTCVVENGQLNCDGSKYKWTKIPMGAPDGSGVKIISYGAFSYYASGQYPNGQQKMVQSLIGEDGTSFGRYCDVGATDMNYSATVCPWKKDPNKIGIPMPDQPAGKIIGYDVFSYVTSADGVEHISQSLLADNGFSYGRTCVVENGQVNCDGSKYLWFRVAVDPKVIAYGAFSYYSGSQQKVQQALINNDGTTSYRTCDVGATGLNMSVTVCPWSYGTLGVPNVLGAQTSATAPVASPVMVTRAQNPLQNFWNSVLKIFKK